MIALKLRHPLSALGDKNAIGVNAFGDGTGVWWSVLNMTPFFWRMLETHHWLENAAD